MNEGEQRQRTITSSARLTPGEIATRSFPSAFRGISESEVRAFLEQVAEDLTASREREQELLRALGALEERVRVPAKLDEQQLLDALGEETTRLLRSAREAAEDIRRKAEERAARTVKEAQDDARRMREEAEQLLTARTQEADTTAAELVRDAEERAAEIRAGSERYAEEQKLRVDRECDAVLDDARATGREMLEEAKALRERVLADLARRRGLLQAQLEELRSGRDRLLEAYRVVKRSFLEATEALAQAEARVQTERPATPVTPAELALLEGEEAAAGAAGLGETGRAGGVEGPSGPTAPEAVTGTVEAGATIPGSEPAVPEPAGVEGEPEAAVPEPAGAGGEPEGEPAVAEPEAPGEPVPAEPEGGPGRERPDVDSLFERLRREQAVVEGEEAAEPVGAAEVSEEGGVEPEVEPAPQPPTETVAEEPSGAARGAGLPTGAWLAARDAALEPLVAPLTKRAKRAAQDEQNEVLDAVRRVKGRPSSEEVLAAPEAQLARWGTVLEDALTDAYLAGRATVGRDASRETFTEPLLIELTGLVVLPLRERVAIAVDDAADLGSETQALVVERIGARYREWKSQSLTTLLGDALAVAFARGVYDAVPDGALLLWIPTAEGRCPDCDDNALEPTAKGAVFPTGQALPPAHPGCRCLVAPGEAEAGAAEARPA